MIGRSSGSNCRARLTTVLAAGFVLVVLVAGCFAARVTTIAPFAPVDGHFRIAAPGGTMTESVSTGAGPFAGAPIHTFLHDEPGGPRFVIVYGDADPAYIAARTTDAALDEFTSKNLGATNGQLASQRDVTISGLPGREQRIVGPGGTYVFRTVLAGNRLYSISATGTDLQVQAADVLAYLDSFSLVP